MVDGKGQRGDLKMDSPLDSLLTIFKNHLHHLAILGFSMTLFSACFKIFFGTM
jgi:hypothetical protein